MSISAYTVVPPQKSVGDVIPTVATILGTSSPIGGIVATAINVLQALGVTIKGKTQHISYDAAIGKAVDFSNACMPIFKKAYTDGEIGGIVNSVPARFQRAMTERWGFDGLNGSIYQSIMQSPKRNDALSNQLGLFFIWVATNVDAESQDEFGIVFDAYFAAIFLGAISDAGLSATKLKGQITPTPPNTPTTDEPTKPTENQKAGSTNIVLLLGLLGAVWYAMKGGK